MPGPVSAQPTSSRPAPTSTGCGPRRRAAGAASCGSTPPRRCSPPARRTPGWCWSASSRATRRTGRAQPFVGPAGRLLVKAVDEAGIDRAVTYRTNAVKHFRFTQAGPGKRRIHQTPDLRHITACRPWLVEELRLVDPRSSSASAPPPPRRCSARRSGSRGPRRAHRAGHHAGPAPVPGHDPSVGGAAGRRPGRGVRRAGGRPPGRAAAADRALEHHGRRRVSLVVPEPVRRAAGQRQRRVARPAGWPSSAACAARSGRGDPAPAAAARGRPRRPHRRRRADHARLRRRGHRRRPVRPSWPASWSTPVTSATARAAMQRLRRARPATRSPAASSAAPTGRRPTASGCGPAGSPTGPDTVATAWVPDASLADAGRRRAGARSSGPRWTARAAGPATWSAGRWCSAG